jgi:hypothetical protein
VLNGSAWSPIATAPKNSTAKLVWCPERQNIYAVTWLAKRGWLVFGGGLLREQPTLWMPMPQSPPTDDFDDSSDSWPDDDDALCERCKGDGRDPMTDYLLPCSLPERAALMGDLPGSDHRFTKHQPNHPHHMSNDQAIENEIQALGLTAPRVKLDDLNANIASVEIVKHIAPSGQVLRWAVLTTRSGYAVTGRPSVSVSSENDRAELGEQIARDNARDELWALMGYALKERLAGPTDAQVERFLQWPVPPHPSGWHTRSDWPDGHQPAGCSDGARHAAARAGWVTERSALDHGPV